MAQATPKDCKQAELAIKHVVNDYTNLIWCHWAVQQDQLFSDLSRSHIAFSYFYPHRAFFDFFTNKERYEGRKGEDVLAIDFSDSPRDKYVRSKWDHWFDHMNTHLFHINYWRTENTTPFNAAIVVQELYPEFQVNWRKFISGLRGDFPELFKKEVERRRPEFPTVAL